MSRRYKDKSLSTYRGLVPSPQTVELLCKFRDHGELTEQQIGKHLTICQTLKRHGYVYRTSHPPEVAYALLPKGERLLEQVATTLGMKEYMPGPVNAQSLPPALYERWEKVLGQETVHIGIDLGAGEDLTARYFNESKFTQERQNVWIDKRTPRDSNAPSDDSST